MLFKDQLQFVGQHIKKNKLRVFMTILAATMGCAFLIVLASVGFGLQDSMRNEILSNEAVTKIQLYEETAFTDEQIQGIEEMEHVEVVQKTTSMNAGGHVYFEDRESYPQFFMTNFKDYEKVHGQLAKGRYPTKPNEIIVGYHFGQSLLNAADQKAIEEKSKKAEAEGTYYDGNEEGYKESLIGKKIEFTLTNPEAGSNESEKMEYTIVGITAKPSYDWAIDSTVYFSEDQHEVFASHLKPLLTEQQSGQEESFFYTEYNIYADSLENVKGLLEQLKEKGYSVYSVTEQLEQMDVFFLVLKIGLVFVGTIAVLIASIGIFNTMTMAVTERTREIGVLKAIGASPKLIQRLFLMESTVIGVLGTVIAVVISYGISILANTMIPIILEAAMEDADFSQMNIVFSAIPWQLVVIASVISIGVAMISGWRPARKATKIDVIQALRQEL